MDTYAFDTLMERKTKEILAIYEEKAATASAKSAAKTASAKSANAATNNKKVIPDPSALDFHSKKLIRQINAALDKKLKGSVAYKKKCEEELSNVTS
jgi:hypothetical protein